ncbi:MAG: DUF2779 domain-containing protein [Actinobacteria bacterium]|nr:DUF2779 domain-containing protein [Actinomycetota bacterium]
MLYLSKSKYCKAVQCPKQLWMGAYMPEQFDESVMDAAVLQAGNEVGDLAMGLFGDYVEVPFEKPVSKMVDTTRALLEAGARTIAEASFSYDGNFCSVDILVVEDDGLSIYEVKSSTKLKDIYKHDIAYQVFVLRSLGYPVKSASLVHIDNQYVRHGELELDKLFAIENVTEEVFLLQADVQNRLAFLDIYMAQEEEPPYAIGPWCSSPYNCGFWLYCSRNVPSPSVFDIAKFKLDKKFELYNNGIMSFEDLAESVAINQLCAKQRMQVESYVNDLPPYADKDNIEEFIDSLSFPLYFLDFETYQPAIPPYDGLKPYDQIPFQYSLHKLESLDADLEHFEFLAEAGNDPRRALAEHLCSDIPADSCVTAYNMTFEKSRIKELAYTFPDLSEHLLNICDNIKDLMVPFQKGQYYNNAMYGYYSIKYVLPALFPDDPSLNYGNLEGIHNGSEAMSAFPALVGKTAEEQAIIRRNLLAYCKLDTYAMVKVWRVLYDIAKS